MKLHKNRSWVLGYECLGFILIIALIWLLEMTGLAHLLFGGPPHPGDWRDAILGTLLVLPVWAGVFFLTYRLLGHLLYLEGFIRICGWCRKICYKDKWMTLEEYFKLGFHVGTTHGICPECFKKAQEDTTQLYRRGMLQAEATPKGSHPPAQTPGPTT